ncbi:hypothetical protein PRNP1_009941 [Phytophthora ramorum]
MILRRVRHDKIAVESGRNGRFLQVRAAGECAFDPKELGQCELFTLETDADCALYFVSCHTANVLQCDENGVIKCADENRQLCEAWNLARLLPRAKPILFLTSASYRTLRIAAENCSLESFANEGL